MKIKTIKTQNRRDFMAIYECEHCGYLTEQRGYDDTYFHTEVVPAMKCPTCGKTAPDTYRPLATKYADGEIV